MEIIASGAVDSTTGNLPATRNAKNANIRQEETGTYQVTYVHLICL